MKTKKNMYPSVSLFDNLEEPVGIVVPILTDCDADEDFSYGIDKVGDELPILPLRNLVLFPGVAMPIIIGREKSMNLIKDCMKRKALVGVVCQRDVEIEEPVRADLYDTGVVAEIIRVLDMPDGSTTVILQGKKRLALHELTQEDPYLRGTISLLDDKMPKVQDKEFKALIAANKDLMLKMLMTAAEPQREIVFSLKNNRNAMYVVNFGCANLVPDNGERQMLLEIDELKGRAYKLLSFLNRENQLLELKANIQMKTQEDLDKQQKAR